MILASIGISPARSRPDSRGRRSARGGGAPSRPRSAARPQIRIAWPMLTWLDHRFPLVGCRARRASAGSRRRRRSCRRRAAGPASRSRSRSCRATPSRSPIETQSCGDRLPVAAGAAVLRVDRPRERRRERSLVVRRPGLASPVSVGEGEPRVERDGAQPRALRLVEREVGLVDEQVTALGAESTRSGRSLTARAPCREPRLVVDACARASGRASCRWPGRITMNSSPPVR